MKQKMIGVRLEGAPAMQGCTLAMQIIDALADDGPLAHLNAHGREAFYAGMAGAILTRMMIDVGPEAAAHVMDRLAEMVGGMLADLGAAEPGGRTLQ